MILSCRKFLHEIFSWRRFLCTRFMLTCHQSLNSSFNGKIYIYLLIFNYEDIQKWIFLIAINVVYILYIRRISGCPSSSRTCTCTVVLMYPTDTRTPSFALMCKCVGLSYARRRRHRTDHTKYDMRTHVWAKMRFTKFWSNKGTWISRFRVSTTS
jgi:hypothetical protein